MSSPQPIDWQSLRHAYGYAVDTQPLLERLLAFPDESNWQSEPWFSLWSSLYHQGDIFSASLAAVPEIVSALANAPQRATLSFYLLPASIAIADAADPVSVSPAIRIAFSEAVTRLGTIATSALPTISNQDILMAAKAAILVSNGEYQQASDLLESDA